VLVLLNEVELQFGCHDRLPTALRVELEDIAQDVAWGHGDSAPIRIETVVYDLRGWLRGPWDAADRLGVSLENDVDFGGTHRLRRLWRVVAGDGLKEDALRQAHAFFLGEFGRGHDLSARNAGHVGNDGLHLGDAVITEELLDRTNHGTTFSSAC